MCCDCCFHGRQFKLLKSGQAKFFPPFLPPPYTLLNRLHFPFIPPLSYPTVPSLFLPISLLPP